ncbi:RNA polymerase sigma factor [Sunxiuqinia elliptica]|uniref:RNA polymerase sigma-70 factor (ECF subfamily) n=1 Tax=Sunxiuqinia elliptica TaxID=655355 RepID=A0A4R6GNS8_9BACT|nr:RNA polymerase sigma-70 factor [Sunxiuqinia elliptica]TDN96657.1 RNA polymerase sigma-70 factor (ECF subfamily) [Sunxiuqinia elliptica]TDO55784.1 RNA polymerase sigma-70 factor (ECF subfamily) [Sunxiuqinia elliptica]
MLTKDAERILDEELIKLFIKGDMRAFDDIYAFFNPKLYRFIFSLVKTEEDTEDLVHEVFVKVWENRKSLRKYAAFESYLFTIAYNTTVNFLKSRVKSSQYIEYIKSVQVAVCDAPYVDEVNNDEINEKLWSLIEMMPTRQREVFKMKHFQNYSYKEIAEILNISINTVENHMVKSHKFLKERFGESYLLILLFIHLFL